VLSYSVDQGSAKRKRNFKTNILNKQTYYLKTNNLQKVDWLVEWSFMVQYPKRTYSAKQNVIKKMTG
jgi:hypothetical protein